jgi:putative ABC transport system permease protein
MLLRWSWRDLRGHWVAVVAIALVLAIGTGVFAGLRSTSTWRRQSNDASFAATDLHDLRVSLSAGTFADQGALLERLATIGADDDIAHAAERLVVGTQIDASTPAETILVQARVVGMTFVPATEPGVDRMWVRDGRVPEPGGRPPEAVLEAKFADFYDLPTTGDVIVAGGAPVRYVGLGVGPEDFFVSGPEGSIFA